MTTIKTEMLETEEGIVNCPFCGSDNVRCLQNFDRRHDGFDYYSVVCQDCKAEGPKVDSKAILGNRFKHISPWDKAKWSWNKRVKKYRRAQ